MILDESDAYMYNANTIFLTKTARKIVLKVIFVSDWKYVWPQDLVYGLDLDYVCAVWRYKVLNVEGVFERKNVKNLGSYICINVYRTNIRDDYINSHCMLSEREYKLWISMFVLPIWLSSAHSWRQQ